MKENELDPQKIEKKWQQAWVKRKAFAAPAHPKPGKKQYVLDMFPYPSAQGLHVGHPEGYTASDILTRYLRMKGMDVLHPMGFDSFGLPAENYAIKTGTHPAKTTEANIKNMRRQIKSLGFSYDWDREVITSDPAYYKWTQWIFLKLFEQGLAYEAEAPINWCPKDKTGLANEEVVGGKCERCGTPVEKKNIRQWLVKITDERYIERLLNDLDKLDWPDSIKQLQRNWIGKSEGATVCFSVIASPEDVTALAGSRSAVIEGRGNLSHDNKIATSPSTSLRSAQDPRDDKVIQVFTTRPDTLFGATYLVLAPEHKLVKEITTAEHKQEVEKYIIKASQKSDLDRTDLAKDKTGVFTGAYAINPVNNEKIPVWVADYVLATYGTGAIMAVPAHDERDWEFVKNHNRRGADLNVRHVIIPDKSNLLSVINVHPSELIEMGPGEKLWGKSGKEEQWQEKMFEEIKEGKRCFTGEGIMLPSTPSQSPPSEGGEGKRGYDKQFAGIRSEDFRKAIIGWLEKEGKGRNSVNYKLRDWVFSRQRYWGEPIPMVHCEHCKGQKKLTVIIIHGTGSNSKANWYDWLATELRGQGYEVIVPDMPDSMQPDREKWLSALEKFKDKLNENTVLVGHSLGGVAAMYFLASQKRKIKKLILVAPTRKEMDWVEFKKQHPNDPIEWQEKFHDVGLQPAKVQKNTKDISYYYSDNDVYIPVEIPERYKKELRGNYHLLPGRNHFSVSNGGAYTFPELLNELKSDAMVVGKKAHELHFYNQNAWGKIISGRKTVETRALNPEEPERYFGNIKVGETLKLVNMVTQEAAFYRVTDVHTYKQLPDFFADKENFKRLAPEKEYESIKDLEAAYAYTPGYVEKIKKNGLIAFGILPVQPGVIPVPEKDLPVELPKVEKYEPTGTGESPLASISKWVNTKCPVCGGPAKRETNTMPQWAGSNWYWLRYCDSNNDKKFADPKKLAAWLPVDVYVGGAEHAVLHLLYARFIYKVLCDIGEIPKEVVQKHGDEPFIKLKNQGLILGEDGQKMSKSRGNVINPDDVIHEYGADAVRMYEMFMGPFEDAKPWSTQGIRGVTRFLERIWETRNRLKQIDQLDDKRVQDLTKRLSEGIEGFQMNTCVSDLMKWSGFWKGKEWIPKSEYETFLKLLSPFAPHITEEIWHQLGHQDLLCLQTWPKYSDEIYKDALFILPVQINGKKRHVFEDVDIRISEHEVRALCNTSPQVQKWLAGKEPKQFRYVPGKIVSIVV